MNKFLGGACVLMLALFSGVTAHAGDYKGFYVGGNIGGASGDKIGAQTSTIFSPTGYFAASSVPAITTTGNQKLGPSGFAGAGQAGYNIQHLGFVLGFEVDYGAMNMSDKKSGTTTYPCCAPTNFTVTQFAGTSWLFTARPRIGFTGGPLLVYGTGGLAVTNYEYTAVFTDTFATAHESARKESNQNGWTAGVGAEFKTGKHWGWKGEYLRASFGGASTQTSTNLTAFPTHAAFPSNVFTHSVGDLGGVNIYRFGFNYHF